MKYLRSIIFLVLMIMTSALTATEADIGTGALLARVASHYKVMSLTDATVKAVSRELSSMYADAADSHSKDHHPEVKLFGRPVGVLAQFGVMVFNFLLFFGILFFALRGALSSAFKSQREELKNRLFQSERDKEEAERQVQELETRMADLQQELGSVMAKADMDAKHEQNQILESAKAEVAHIMSRTHADVESLKQSAKAELHAMVMELVVASVAQRLTAQLHGDLAAKTLDQAIEKVRGNK